MWASVFLLSFAWQTEFQFFWYFNDFSNSLWLIKKKYKNSVKEGKKDENF